MTKMQTTILPNGRVISKASTDDFSIVMELIEKGKTKMIKAGNPNQWSTDYPNKQTVKYDIVRGDCYLLCESGTPIATFVFRSGPEPNYLHIYNGAWLDNEPYYVIHRVASREGVRGVMADIISFGSTFTSSIRFDTHADNKPMQAALSRLEFVYCGIIYVENGDSRQAYQRSFQAPSMP